MVVLSEHATHHDHDHDHDHDEWDHGEEPGGLYTDEPSPRRGQATLVMVLATIVFVGSLVVLAAFLTGGAFQDALDFLTFTTWIWVFVILMVVLFFWLLILLLTTPSRMQEDWYDEPEHEAPERTSEGVVVARYADESTAPSETIALRCPRCSNIFTLQDPQERPFQHRCPHCEVQGIYRGP